MVQRYDPVHSDEYEHLTMIEEQPDGDYVLFDDYARLQAELAEIKQSHEDIINEPCAGDEVHCTCVPALRAEIKSLQADLERATNDATAMNKQFLNAVEEVQEKTKELEHEKVERLSIEYDCEFAECKMSEQAVEIKRLQDELERILAKCERLTKGIKAVADLIEQSGGVYGLHLNGDPAPWSDLTTGGYFENWLIDFDDALQALADAERKEAEGGKN